MATKAELKIELNSLIDYVPKTKHKDLLNDFKELNKKLEHRDRKIVNLFQSISRKYFSKNIVEKMKKYINDILDNYNKYSDEEKILIKSFIEKIIDKYSDEDRNYWDKFLSVLGGS